MQIDPALLGALASAIEYVANEALKYDPASRQQLNELEGECLAIVFTDKDFTLQISIFDSRISVAIISKEHFDESGASTILRGKLADFIQLARQKSHSLAGSGVEAQGNIAILEALQSLFENLDIDWQDALHQKLGPAAAPLSAAINSVASYLQQSSSNSIETVKHYFQYEANLGVHNQEFERFQNEVSTLRQGADRLEAKLQHLLRHPNLKGMK